MLIVQLIFFSSFFRRRHVEGFDNTETNRETLREMLSKMRRDPFDDEVEKSDGEFFPCEFCGDPYPVEYLMRHQVGKIFSVKKRRNYVRIQNKEIISISLSAIM